MADFLVEVEKTVKETVTLKMELWTLNIEKGGSGSPTRILSIFRPMDDDGNWIEGVEPIRVEITDDPNSENEQMQVIATLLRTFILDAIIPKSGLADGFGISGMAIRDAGQSILQALGKV